MTLSLKFWLTVGLLTAVLWFTTNGLGTGSIELGG